MGSLDFHSSLVVTKCVLSLLPGWYQRRSNGESELSPFLEVAGPSLPHSVSGWHMAALTLLRDISRGLLGSQKFHCHSVATRTSPGRYK